MAISSANKKSVNEMNVAAQRITLGTRLDAFRRYIVTAADATANQFTIDTGFSGAGGFIVQIYRSGVDVHGDAVVTMQTPGVIVVADGATYNVTAGDIAYVIAF